MAAVGHDTTPERSDLVAVFTVLTVGFLVAVTVGLWSFYKLRAEQERLRKAEPLAEGQQAPADGRALLEQQRQELERRGIGVAMTQVARRGRQASSALAPAPQPFDDAPLKGWSAAKGVATMGGIRVLPRVEVVLVPQAPPAAQPEGQPQAAEAPPGSSDQPAAGAAEARPSSPSPQGAPDEG